MTTFSDDQKKELAAPLSSSNVSSRRQGGRQLSYIEGWHAIAEANRIFGFDGWRRETVQTLCVADAPREIGERKEPGFGVSYIAKVKVTVGDIVREGCGAGHGIDRDHGLAHESALKEAETDAMKRALMTFGNPFGLALYDKQQTNVSDEPQHRKETTKEIVAREAYIAGVMHSITEYTDKTKLWAWWRSDRLAEQHTKYNISTGEYELMKAAVLARGEALNAAAQP